MGRTVLVCISAAHHICIFPHPGAHRTIVCFEPERYAQADACRTRNVQDFFDLASEEKCAILELVGDCKRVIEKTEKPAGYNIGLNVGTVGTSGAAYTDCDVKETICGSSSTENKRSRQLGPTTILLRRNCSTESNSGINEQVNQSDIF